MHHTHQVCRTLISKFVHLLVFLACRRSTKTHPGPVVHISDNPMDEGKVTDSRPLRKHRRIQQAQSKNRTFCGVRVFHRCTFLSSPGSCFSADGTKSIWLVPLQWRVMAEHFKLIEISMGNIRIQCSNKGENVLFFFCGCTNASHCSTEKITATAAHRPECFSPVTASRVGPNTALMRRNRRITS